jgi:hypothetical protein
MLERLCELFHPCVGVHFCFVFAPTMAGDDDKKHLHDMQAEIDGLVTDQRVDSTVTTANARFDQLDLA